MSGISLLRNNAKPHKNHRISALKIVSVKIKDSSKRARKYF